MVLIASLPSGSLKIESVQLPVMSRPGEGDATERYGHYVVGDVPAGEPGKSADWRGERRDQENLYSRRGYTGQGQAEERNK